MTTDGRSTRQGADERVAEILDAAMEVFGRRGYRQGSLKDVAAAVGLTVQGVLHHFPTKQQLLMATLEHRTAIRSTTMAAIREADGVVAVMRYLLADNLANPGLMRLIVTVSAEATDPDHPAHGYFVRRYRIVHDDLRSAFAAEQEHGRGPALDPDAAASLLVAIADGLQLQLLLRPELDLLAEFDRLTADLHA